MQKEQMTEIEKGKAIQDAIRAAKAWRKRPTLKNLEKYNLIFENLYKFFYNGVYGMIQSITDRSVTEEDIEDLCNDILIEIRENLHKFR